MKVELRKIKIIPELSEETTCFSAEIFIDGKRVGTAENRGHGGPTDYHFAFDKDRKVRDAFEAYAKSLPPVVYPARNGFDEMTIPMDGEALVDKLVTDYLNEKDAKRIEKAAAKAKREFDAKGFPITVQYEFADGRVGFFGSKTREAVERGIAKYAREAPIETWKIVGEEKEARREN